MRCRGSISAGSSRQPSTVVADLGYRRRRGACTKSKSLGFNNGTVTVHCQLPHVRAWAEKYKGKELVVVGVHSPEFRIEKDLDNVEKAARDRKMGFPVAVDNDFAIWRAFDNKYWPALYIIDAQGRIRHHQFGEGGYEKTERIIQQLLGEAGDRLTAVDARGVEAEAAWDDLELRKTTSAK